MRCRTRSNNESADALTRRREYEIAYLRGRTVRRRYLYLCGNAELLQKLDGRFQNRPIGIAPHENCHFHETIILPILKSKAISHPVLYGSTRQALHGIRCNSYPFHIFHDNGKASACQ